MVVRVIEAKEDKVTMADLIADLKKSNKLSENFTVKQSKLILVIFI